MELPFTIEQFFDVFREYNEAVWPAQIALFVLALIGIVLVVKPLRWGNAAVSGILAVLWTWMAIGYHIAFFAQINPLAYAFAILSLVGAAIFVWEGLFRRRLRFKPDGGVRSWAGAVFTSFALLVYPAWSWVSGHTYPHMPTFGLPCPTTLYTIGILAFLEPPYPRKPHVVPVLWSVIGAQAALLLDVQPDLSLTIAAITGIVLALRARSGAGAT